MSSSENSQSHSQSPECVIFSPTQYYCPYRPLLHQAISTLTFKSSWSLPLGTCPDSFLCTPIKHSTHHTDPGVCVSAPPATGSSEGRWGPAYTSSVYSQPSTGPGTRGGGSGVLQTLNEAVNNACKSLLQRHKKVANIDSNRRTH